MKTRSSYVCQQCGYETPQWYGKCPSCGNWNTMVETVKEMSNAKFPMSNKKRNTEKSVILSQVKHIESDRLKSGYGEFDRVVGGGIVPGSVTLLAGDPGIGKSTLLLHVLSKIGGLYVAGEESTQQVKLRANRLGIDGANIQILADTNLESIVENVSTLKETHLKLVIVDSIQTLSSDELDGTAGSVGQIRYCAEQLTAYAKRHHIAVIIIGHVTKEGTIAGPKILEHMVDAVLYLEGERFAAARILRTLKNRFGAVEEVGIFEMVESGLIEITDPSELFLKDRVKNVPGSVITVILEGTRPLLVEIQALVVPTQLAIPRRVGSGFDYNRLQLLVAILQKRLNIPLGTFDIFINVSGGLKVNEPAVDLAVAMAIVSSFKNKSIDPKSVVFGEVGLLGEVRTTASEERRIKEAKRLGFTTVVSPKTATNIRSAANVIE